MKHRISSYLICILIGIGIGWTVGYMRPVAKHQRELLKKYQMVKDQWHATDEEMAAMSLKVSDFYTAMKERDEFGVIVALNASRHLARGEVETARNRLAQTVGKYYRDHRKDGDTNIIAHIEQAALDCPAIAVEMKEKPE